jgi:hypothetical protein
MFRKKDKNAPQETKPIEYKLKVTSLEEIDDSDFEI